MGRLQWAKNITMFFEHGSGRCRMRVLECQLFFYELERRKCNFDFQFSIFKTTEIENKISNFNFQCTRKTKIEIKYQFLIFMENGYWNLEASFCNSHFNFRLKTWSFDLQSVILTSDKSEKAGNKRGPEGDKGQSLWI